MSVLARHECYSLPFLMRIAHVESGDDADKRTSLSFWVHIALSRIQCQQSNSSKPCAHVW